MILIEPNQGILGDYAILPTPVYHKYTHPVFGQKEVVELYFSSVDSLGIGQGYKQCFDIVKDSEGITKELVPISEILPVITFPTKPVGTFFENGINITHVDGELIQFVGYRPGGEIGFNLWPGTARIAGSIAVVSYIPSVNMSHKNVISCGAMFRSGDINYGWYCKEVVNLDKPRMSCRLAMFADGKMLQEIPMGVKSDEFSFGRPWIVKWLGGSESMYFCVRSVDKDMNVSYNLGYAERPNHSSDWERKDSLLNDYMPSEIKGFDDKSRCYPAVVKTSTDVIIFWNGNDNGKTGIRFSHLYRL